MMKFGNLIFEPVINKIDLIASSVKSVIESDKLHDIFVSEIDSKLSDTAAFCEKYDIKPEECANCVVIEAKRADKIWHVACVILANSKIDINGKVRKFINARKVSFAQMELAVKMTNMEFGAITPIGLPNDWMILVDNKVTESQNIIIGSGLRKSKILLSGELLNNIPNVVVMDIIKSDL